MINKITYYHCYSINMLRFIKSHFIYPVSKSINPNTSKTAWIFEQTPELSKVLTAWTEQKAKFKANNQI